MTAASEILHPGDAARYLGISVETLRRYSDEGQIACRRYGSGHRRYTLAELDRFIAETARHPAEARS